MYISYQSFVFGSFDRRFGKYTIIILTEKTFRSSFRRESKVGFGRNASIWVGRAKRFQGQTSWQVSQP